ncbi:hypothetical protein B4098_0563 [Heyndrickxia coagulans]|uniref:Uncharacterized protein n=1 Tax=Heyndrickxia coagulans TaxID=1398 RepID=A0A150K5Q7_HEYCO|nr:hypothetical protein B4098_0563 [Heyndrickxia coagulans]
MREESAKEKKHRHLAGAGRLYENGFFTPCVQRPSLIKTSK